MAQEELEPTEGQGEGGGHEVTPQKSTSRAGKAGWWQMMLTDFPRSLWICFSPAMGQGVTNVTQMSQPLPSPPKPSPSSGLSSVCWEQIPANKKDRKNCQEKRNF